MMTTISLRLSVIIPTLDEATALPVLLRDLAAQQGIDLEVLVVDGGSRDATASIAAQALESFGLPGQVVTTNSGRGQQLNHGAGLARGRWLCFLHADSRLPDPDTLLGSVDLLDIAAQNTGCRLLAGHLTLTFDLPDEQRTYGYRFYEHKARSGRPWTIHGDQGMFIRPEDFLQVGGFRDDLPVMEDSYFAEAVRRMGDWMLLPGRILTSPRRFQVEGMSRRQTLNALMMNFLAIGWDDFFTAAPDLYRKQSRTAPLELLPFFSLITELLSFLPFAKRWQIWTATGSYVRSQNWQIGLYLDTRHLGSHRSEARVGQDWLSRFDRWVDPLTDHKAGQLVTALLVRLWFAWTYRRLRIRSLDEEP